MPIRPAHILGMNARYYYTRLNSARAKSYGFSKLRTKELLNTHNIPTAQLYHVFNNLQDLQAINWSTIPVPFVIKPASGSAGKGIFIISKRGNDDSEWFDHKNNLITTEDIELHVGNILDGEFSTWGTQHKAMIEEFISPHQVLAKLSYKGTPDIRVIVYNSVPVMAMVRIPTQESGGRANLDQGAIGLGVDMATGVTTSGIYGKSGNISHFPNSKRKVNGILIPEWQKILETAVQAADAAGYTYMGADIFIDKEKGPMIVELNGFPGLSIQLANNAGLKRRLERVEGLEVRDSLHGVKIAQALFAENVSDKFRVEEGIKIIPINPKVTVYGENRTQKTVPSFVNTGKYRSAISENTAQELGLVDLDDLLWRQTVEVEGKVPVVEVKFKLKGRTVTTAMTVVKRLNKTSYKVELGRKDTEGFLIGENE